MIWLLLTILDVWKDEKVSRNKIIRQQDFVDVATRLFS